MTVSKKTFWFFFVVTTFAVMGFFQNCAPVAFKENSVQLASVEVLSCHFNGQEVPSGESVKAYLMSSVPFGETCKEEGRRCDNGNLSGSYSFAQCAAGVPASCLFDGRTIAHGESVDAFLNSAVAFGQSCSSEARRCDNGNLSGSYSFSQCAAGVPASCLFNGRTIAHGESVEAFLNSAVAFGQSCSSEVRRCNNGHLDGSYSYSNCGVGSPASCSFNGQTLAHNQSVLAFVSSTVPYGATCSSQSRLCQNGVLSGSHQYANCAANGPTSCLFNGRTLAHGESVQVFASSTVPYGGSCLASSKSCNNGVMTGPAGYEATSCAPGAPANCYFNGATVVHGASVSAFANSSVPYGSSCQSQTRTCNNGNLSGSFDFGSCTPGTAAGCQFAGVTYPHGATINAYLSNTGNPGCVAETRQCNNGNWSGSYPYKSCSVYQYFWGTSAFVSGPVGNCVMQSTSDLPACTEATFGTQVPNRIFRCDSGETLNGIAYCRRNETNYN